VRRSRHANQTKLSLSSIHAKARVVANLLDRISHWLAQFVRPAQQLERAQRWAAMVVRIYKDPGLFPLDGKPDPLPLDPVNCRN
jgi:hypothetical protein